MSEALFCRFGISWFSCASGPFLSFCTKINPNDIRSESVTAELMAPRCVSLITLAQCLVKISTGIRIFGMMIHFESGDQADVSTEVEPVNGQREGPREVDVTKKEFFISCLFTFSSKACSVRIYRFHCTLIRVGFLISGKVRGVFLFRIRGNRRPNRGSGVLTPASLMASSKVMSSRSPPNQDPPPQQNPSSPLNLISGDARSSAAVCMDDLFRNVYPDSDAFLLGSNGGAGGGKAVDEDWRDIIRGGKRPVTLEDFLVTAGTVNEEDVRIPAAAMPIVPPAFGLETPILNPAAGAPFAPAAASGRGKRRPLVEEPTMDKATQQKQRRMIKNRESAARSRERKQAHTVELESLVSQLEEDNARLLREEAEMNRERYNQLMKTVIPIDEQRRPPRRRTNSMEW